MMDPQKLGCCGLRVSPVCLGTANFGFVTGAAAAHRMMSMAMDAGMNFIDTADMYNRKQGEDASELIIGRWLAEDPTRRQGVVLATKVYGVTGNGANDSGRSARHIRSACEDSLRLRTDWIDIYMLHHIDRNVPWEETLEAVHRLITDGKVLYIGTSNFAAWQLTAFHLAALQKQMLGVANEQSPYSLAERRVEFEVLPACRHFRIGFLAYSPLAGRLLAGPQNGLRRSQGATGAHRIRETERLAEWYLTGRSCGLEPSSAALAWMVAQNGVCSAVIGPRDEAQLQACVKAMRQSLPEDVATAIWSLWPEPGIAPEVYSW